MIGNPFTLELFYDSLVTCIDFINLFKRTETVNLYVFDWI